MKVNQKEQKKVDRFNAKYKVGDKVIVKKDDRSLHECTIRHEATLLSGHTAMGWFNEISGCYLLDRVQP